jgi:hypothetical protein
MAKKRRIERVFPTITIDSIRILNRLIPFRMTESITARSDKLAIAVLQKFFGPDWIRDHIEASRRGFLRVDNTTPEIRETQRMRRMMLAEILYNLQKIKGFTSCLVDLYTGQIESSYAALEIGRLLCTQALDRKMSFHFVTRSGIKKRDYDLSITFSDGVAVHAETKCKMEATKITLRTIEESFSTAKAQLPDTVPGIVFVKVPRIWIDDEAFVAKMYGLADRFLARSPSILSVKYYVVKVVQERDQFGEAVGEIVGVHERLNPNHRFRKFASRDWRMFPNVPGPLPSPRTNYNGMPESWQRLIVQNTTL